MESLDDDPGRRQSINPSAIGAQMILLAGIVLVAACLFAGGIKGVAHLI